MCKKFNITHIIIFKMFLFFCIINNINSALSFINSLSISLDNGDIFIIHKYGINVCNQEFSKKIKAQLHFLLKNR